jgi:23S rRNA pseudouridine2605 synthase
VADHGNNNRSNRPQRRRESDNRGGSRDNNRSSGGSNDREKPRSRSDRDDRRSFDKGEDNDSRYRDNRGEKAQRTGLHLSEQAGGDLPRWVRDEVQRVTSKDRREPTLDMLGAGAHAFAGGNYRKALPSLKEAKKLSPRTATIRELLGLTLYRLGDWEDALRELRTYRRLEGDTTHMAVEVDCLRALERPADVHKTWKMYRSLGGRPNADAEMRVVYGAFLLDEGQPRDAWAVVKPGRLVKDAAEWTLRQWFVAARVAIELGDIATARQLVKAIEARDAGFPGISELSDDIA